MDDQWILIAPDIDLPDRSRWEIWLPERNVGYQCAVATYWKNELSTDGPYFIGADTCAYVRDGFATHCRPIVGPQPEVKS